ncbi:MAG: hypothetical protein IH621_08115 [Krumholzibacteria bacterium]|nr:hypothetical protein [Candidatus Krumholzibacteria bacterium]
MSARYGTTKLFFTIILAVALLGAVSASADISNVILVEQHMRFFAACPAGDIVHNLSFYLVDDYGSPIVGANTRISFYTNAEPYSVVFCDDPTGGQSDYFYPVGSEGNTYHYTFALAAGVEVDHTSHNVRMRVEWGSNYEFSDLLLPFISSPDLNGDLVVNLGDYGVFATIFRGDYDLRADLDNNGEVNLGDIAILVNHVGHTCP